MLGRLVMVSHVNLSSDSVPPQAVWRWCPILGGVVMVSHVSLSLMVSLLARLGMVSHVRPSGNGVSCQSVFHGFPVSPSWDSVPCFAVWRSPCQPVW